MIQELYVAEGELEIRVQVIRSNRKTMGLEVKENLEVYARIPRKTTDRELKGFIRKYQEWICRKYREMQKVSVNRQITPPRPELTTEEKERIKDKIAKRVSHYEQIMGLSANHITIKNQKTRWGSCSSKKNLNFNYRLAYMPQEILDYVVIHELAHLRHMNHSKQFWALVEQYLPDYRERRRWLKEYGQNY